MINRGIERDHGHSTILPFIAIDDIHSLNEVRLTGRQDMMWGMVLRRSEKITTPHD